MMGCKVRMALLLLGLAVVGVTYAQNAGARCLSPNGEPGICTLLTQCPQLLSLLQASPRTQASITYLRRSQCGFEGRNPVVCCAQVAGGGGSPGNQQNPGNFEPGLPNRNEASRPNFEGPPPNQGGSDIGGGNGASLLPTECGRDYLNRIVGGNITELGEFPWMALMEYEKPSGLVTACGAVVISKRYILTAAHCVTGRAFPRSYRLRSVRLGEYNTATHPDCNPDGYDSQVCSDPPLSISVEQIIPHEDYGRDSSERYDIALLRLEQDIPFSDYIKPICLPGSSTINRQLTVAGWGQTEDRKESDVKLKVEVPLYDKNACAKKYQESGRNIGEGQFCAGGEKLRDSCRGDSGGPLMQQTRLPDGTQRWISVGIVSFGPTPCGMDDFPGVYTKVYDFMPWILSKMRP